MVKGSWVKDRETTHQLPSQATLSQLREFNLIHYQSNQSKAMRNKTES